jgi:hypothetical protein
MWDELIAAGSSGSRGRGGKTRKDLRKDGRDSKRAHSSRGRASNPGLDSGRRQTEPASFEEEPVARRVPKSYPPAESANAKAGPSKRPLESKLTEQPVKKRKVLPELTLPGAGTDDKEDEEIKWLEWTLRHKGKGKGKVPAGELDEDDDGLDGACLRIMTDDEKLTK